MVDVAANTGSHLTSARRTTIVSTLLLATVMASLDSSFTPIAFADMIDKLDTSTAVVVWVALGYLIAATGPMLIMARLADRFGRAMLFKLGATLYSGAMIACGFAPDIDTLILLRAVQGLGMAMFLPTTFTLATEVYPPDQRGKALGLMAAGNAFGFVLGPIFAGWLLDAYDWRALFVARIPLAALTILLAWSVLGPVGTAIRKREYYDLPGAIYLTIALFGLLFGFNRLPVEDNHLEIWVWAIFIAGLVFSVLFLRHERNYADPLVDLGLFRDHPTFTKASAAFTFMFVSMPVYLFVLPILLLNGMEMLAWDVGLIMAIIAVVTTLTATPAGKLADRFGAAIPCVIGATSTFIGYSILFVVPLENPVPTLIAGMAFTGLGVGLFTSPNNALILSNVPPERMGMSSGLIGTFRQTGYAVGFAVIASLFTAVQDYLEEAWTVYSLSPLSAEAAQMSVGFFDAGSVNSPEVLIFIFRMTAIICAAATIPMIVNSIPNIRMTFGRHAVTVLGSGAVAAIAVLMFAQTSQLAPPASGQVDATQTGYVADAFGMAQKTLIVREEAQIAGVSGGQEVFMNECSYCHGADAMGLTQEEIVLGVQLANIAFVRDLSDADLIAFIRTGREADAEDSKSGNLMPAIDYLEDGDYAALVAYLRSIQ